MPMLQALHPLRYWIPNHDVVRAAASVVSAM